MVMSVSHESVTVIGHAVNQSLQNDNETQSATTPDQADTLSGPSSTPSSQSSIPGSQSSIPASQSSIPVSRGREQGTGRFAVKLDLNVKGTQGRSEGQKKADKVASNVTKWIGRAVMNMEKIQKVRLAVLFFVVVLYYNLSTGLMPSSSLFSNLTR